MVSPSKRPSNANDAFSCKRIKPSGGGDSPVRRDLLERCYACVTTLREHVLAKLPSASRLRRKKIASIGYSPEPSETESRLAHLLDTTLVCVHESNTDIQDVRWEQWLSFSQKADESNVSISDGVAASYFSQSEVSSFMPFNVYPLTIYARLSTLSSGSCSRERLKEGNDRSTCCAMASERRQTPQTGVIVQFLDSSASILIPPSRL